MLLTFGVALMLQNVMIWCFARHEEHHAGLGLRLFKLGGVNFDAVGERPAGEPGAAVLPCRPAEVLTARRVIRATHSRRWRRGCAASTCVTSMR